MAFLNKVILLGSVGSDPELRSTPAGDPVTSVRLATTERWSVKGGEQKEATQWHRVAFFGKLATAAAEQLHKGSFVYVEGKLATRRWKQPNGEERSVVEVRALRMQIIGAEVTLAEALDAGS